MADTRRWFWLGGVLLLCAFVWLLHPILTPFLVALLLAYLFDPLVDRLETAGLSRTWGVIAVFALFTLIFTTLLLVLVPMLAKQLFRLYELAPQMLDWLQHTALPWAQSKFGLSEGFWKFDKLKAAISEHMGQTTDIVGVVLSQATASGLALIGWLANLVLIPVVSFYLLRDWDLMMAKIRSLLPRDREEQAMSLAEECHEVLGAFVRGQLLVMVALGVIYAAGLMLVGLELGLLIGMIAGSGGDRAVHGLHHWHWRGADCRAVPVWRRVVSDDGHRRGVHGRSGAGGHGADAIAGGGPHRSAPGGGDLRDSGRGRTVWFYRRFAGTARGGGDHGAAAPCA